MTTLHHHIDLEWMREAYRRTRKDGALGIPTLEDKVAQRAVLMLIEPIYEVDFMACSYGFRPGRSAHDALRALRTGIMENGHRWVIDADLSSYFASISHKHLRGFLDLRVKDGVVRRMIDKWLKAGVLEEGAVHRPQTGTPQNDADEEPHPPCRAQRLYRPLHHGLGHAP